MNRKIFTVLALAVMLLSSCSGSLSTNVTKQTDASVKVEQSSKDPNLQTNSNVPSNKSGKLQQATIVKNIDGDTVEIRFNGRVEKVRMLCVDTPETHHPRLGVQPFGPEASAFTKKILYVGRNVQIEPAIGGGRDKYGRLLAYIYVNGKMFNEMLLERGLARVAYIYAPNTKYVDEFYSIQKKAQQKGIGIWSIENYVHADGFHKEAATNNGETTATEPVPSSSNAGKTPNQNNPGTAQVANLKCKGKIKGNANSHIYHVPGSEYYDAPKTNIVWFCSEKEAIHAGYRKSMR